MSAAQGFGGAHQHFKVLAHAQLKEGGRAFHDHRWIGRGGVVGGAFFKGELQDFMARLVLGEKMQVHEFLFRQLQIGHHPNDGLFLGQLPNEVRLGQAFEAHGGLRTGA